MFVVVVSIVNQSGSPADGAGLPVAESSGGDQVGGVGVTGRECPTAGVRPIGEPVTF